MTDNLTTSGGVSVIVGASSGIPQDVRDAFRASRVSDARRAGVRILYENVDITTDIAPWLLGVEYTDSIDKADDLQLNIWDDGRWRGAWAPTEGAKLSAELHISEGGQTARIQCGTFAIDEIEYSGPPTTACIKATSAWVTTALRREQKTRAWESITLKGIAETVAKKAGLQLLYSARNNPTYNRIDQCRKGDLEWLRHLATREGLRVKVSDGQLILYSQEEFDAMSGIETLHWGDGRIIGYRFATGITTGYSKCKCKWRDPHSKKVHEFEYIPDDAPATGQTLRINERCESEAEAERVGKHRLQAKNRRLKDGSLDLVGDIRMLAGQNIEVSGFGSAVDGKLAIEEARHSLWPYTVGLGLRKVTT
jgi:hypothetical protein